MSVINKKGKAAWHIVKAWDGEGIVLSQSTKDTTLQIRFGTDQQSEEQRMNFDAELKKPLFVVQGRACTLNEARDRIPITALNSKNALVGNRNTALANEGLSKIASAGASLEVRNLVVARLRADPQSEFRFIDGRKFTGSEAAQEVVNHTKEGEYFLKIEKRTMEIVLDAIKKGRVQ
ncbi:MAG TPA: hypothetical protein VM260_14085 [Pirellula sp.]|nr:hypothetical protein [Pirellula sp.]